MFRELKRFDERWIVVKVLEHPWLLKFNEKYRLEVKIRKNMKKHKYIRKFLGYNHKFHITTFKILTKIPNRQIDTRSVTVYLIPNPNRTIPMVSKEYQLLLLIIIFLLALLIMRVDHEKKRRNSKERSALLNLLETILGIIVVLGVSWLVLSTAETLVEVGSVIDGSGVDHMMFNAGFDCGDTMVWKDILEWGAGEVSFWGGGNWIDQKVNEFRYSRKAL